MIRKKVSIKKYFLDLLEKIRAGDLLLIVVGVLVILIVITIAHYNMPGGDKFPSGALAMTSILLYFDIFIKKTTYKYVFFFLIPLLTVWIANLFQRKTWNLKKKGLWLAVGIVIMLLLWFGMPTESGLGNIPSAETPDVKLFVMSFCPFGQQAEEMIKPVQDLLRDSITIEPHFVINDRSAAPSVKSGCIKNNTICALHGVKELYENVRQVCIWKDYQDKWWDYVSCINENCDKDDVDTCWQPCAEENQISVAKIRACQEVEGTSIAEKERDLSDELGATGSPSLIINGYKYGGERTPETLKKAICKGFKNPPPECKLKVGSAKPATKKKDELKEKVFIQKVVDRDQCFEEGVCPKTGEKVVLNQTG